MQNSPDMTVSLPYPAAGLIIHRPPMLLIDALLQREGDMAAASAVIDAGSIFLDEDHHILPEYYIEIMAQTMAAANGYDALLLGTPPKKGFIVGLDTFSLRHQPKGPNSFSIRVVKTMEFGSMKVMQGEVLCASESVAAIELKVWEEDDDEK